MEVRLMPGVFSWFAHAYPLTPGSGYGDEEGGGWSIDPYDFITTARGYTRIPLGIFWNREDFHVDSSSCTEP